MGDGVFDSKIHEPNARWRADPATDRQLKELATLGVPACALLTKGEAADIISQHRPAELEDEEFLRFFGIKVPRDMTQYDAAQHIARIIADPDNRQRWEARPATKFQRALIKHVEGSVPANLTEPEADKLIATFDETKSDRADAFRDEWYAAEDAREYREDEIRIIYDALKDDREFYNLAHVRLKDVRRVVAEIESETGKDVIELNSGADFEGLVAARILSGASRKSTAMRMSDGVASREPIDWGAERSEPITAPEPKANGWRPVLLALIGISIVLGLWDSVARLFR